MKENNTLIIQISQKRTLVFKLSTTIEDTTQKQVIAMFDSIVSYRIGIFKNVILSSREHVLLPRTLILIIV